MQHQFKMIFWPVKKFFASPHGYVKVKKVPEVLKVPKVPKVLEVPKVMVLSDQKNYHNFRHFRHL
jgi:hypothetical protein